MDTLEKNQILEFDNLLSIKVRTSQENQSNIQTSVMELMNYAKEQGASKIGPTITSTRPVNFDGSEIDMEFYFPIDKKIPSKNNIIFKDKLYLSNCLRINHKGNPALL